MSYVQTLGFSYFQNDLDPRFKIVTTPDGLTEMMNVLRDAKLVAFDYETTGVKWFKGDRPCGVAFTTQNPGDPEPLNFYVPYRHHTLQHQLAPSKVIAAQKEILTNPAITKLAHNIKFDEHMSHTEGLWVAGNRIDTLIEARLYDENTNAGLKERGFKDLRDPSAQKYDKMLSVDLARLAKRRGLKKTEYLNKFGYSELDIWLAGTYAAMDTFLTWRLHQFYDMKGVYSQFSKSPRGDQFPGIYQVEMKLTEVLCDMERIGIPMDIPYLQDLNTKLMQSRERAESSFFQLAKVDKFNLGSDAELRDYMINGLGLTLTKETKSGAKAVDSDVIAEFVPQHPFLKHVLRWKDVNKKITTYTTSLVELCDEHGVVHGDFRQVGTNTGRLSCKNPNMQNIASDNKDRAEEAEDHIDPESIKRAFIVQRQPGDPFLAHCGGEKLSRLFVDYSQAELRVMAHYSEDKRLLETYHSDDGDIHTAVEQAVFGTTGKYRRMAKVINFGLSYCMSAMGFARQVKGVSMEQAEEYFNEFNAKFPGIPAFRNALWHSAARNKGTFTNMFGRRRTLPDLLSDDRKLLGRAQRQAIGSLIQGTAAELTKDALVRLWICFQERGLKSRPSQTVHDEIQVDGPVSEMAEVARITKYIMEDYPAFRVPIKADVEVSDFSWAHKQGVNI